MSARLLPGRRATPREPRADDATAAARRSVEWLVVVVVGLIVVFANLPFWKAALAGRSLADPATWRFVAGTGLLLFSLQALPVLALSTRATVRPLLAALVVCGVLAQELMHQYGIVLDPSMLRNALRTDWREASELVSTSLLLGAGVAVLAVLALWRVPLRPLPLRQAIGRRLLAIVGILALGVAGTLATFQDLSSTMRNQKELRYRITPANVFYSTGRVLADDLRDARQAREPLQPVRMAGPAAGAGRKPRLLVLVVGETARAMNFSLNGYPRQTNPELARLPVINFPQTRACGSSTEVSLPCMFSSLGRADYDEARIRGGESLPQLLARAGMRVVWLDNQSGCKGVCAGLESQDLSTGDDPALCPEGRCLDAVLVRRLGQLLDAEPAGDGRDLVVVLHQLGNHGPAYHKRYPRAYARFAPACTRTELRDCSREEIVNAYDNAILYTDHVLASTIGVLDGHRDRFDVAMLYVSDHGESLGEKGLYLHGMPYAIAPAEQLSVPMVWWFGGAGVAAWGGVDEACLRRRATEPAHHDNLFHSVLGLMGVETPRYVAGRDLTHGCRAAERTT